MSDLYSQSVDEPPLPRDGSVSDLDQSELSRLARNVRHVVQGRHGLSVRRIYLVGSWARGEAMIGVSDVDLRIITNGAPGKELGEQLREELKPKTEWSPENATLVDAIVTPLEPDESEPKVMIYAK